MYLTSSNISYWFSDSLNTYEMMLPKKQFISRIFVLILSTMETEKDDMSGYVARMAAMRLITKSWSQSFALRTYLQDFGAEWKMILNQIIKGTVGSRWLDLSG